MTPKNIYFIGIGGIGMSALARYFRFNGHPVAGYDRTPSPLTGELEAEGIGIHYDDDIEKIPTEFLSKADTTVVYTPAVPDDHEELNYFRDNGFEVIKRSRSLGLVARGKYVMAVAGTHGKTTTTTMTAHLNRTVTGGGSAFLGGISKNFGSNLVLGKGRRLAVEADEFDRSFLQLFPDAAVITSADADHLDIYGTHEALGQAFTEFVSQIKPGGALVQKQGIDLPLRNPDIRVYGYAYDIPCDFYAKNLALLEGGYYRFDLVCPDRVVEGATVGIPGWVNVENAVAASALVWCAGRADDGDTSTMDSEKLKAGLASFAGVKRRFDFYINTPQVVYMDDYAHHPAELEAALTSLRKMFPGREITALFQPHLYTRTRDFAAGFSQALSLADRALLLPIYPAREEPIPGIDSGLILQHITCNKALLQKDDIYPYVEIQPMDVLVTFGAGDIDRFCEGIAQRLHKRYGI
ncbi:MAG: UDP-N-acetylmuramate--L-alanine ligase [Rikenellaceae bacterium]|nr:UDP-N-acetylmuramate--L-alanine ligase [Rikenellaceae bacterium]